MSEFPTYRQHDSKDCGPACLKIVSQYYGRAISLSKITRLSETTREGSSLLGLSKAAEMLNFRTLGAKLTFDLLKKEAVLPCIVHWGQNHFVVVYKIQKDRIYVSDPAHGLLSYSEKEFSEHWSYKNGLMVKEGIVLLIEPTPSFYKKNDDDDDEGKSGFEFLFRYLFRYKKFLTQLVVGLSASSILDLIFPFLTQSVVDVGIKEQNISFVYLILIAQLFVFFGRTSIEIIRRWIMLHLSTRLNISLISDFFIKLMKLPISYFDVKMTGDLMQRINDHQRIQSFLTGSTLSTVFSIFNFVIFGGVLIYYSTQIFFLFLLFTVVYFAWILFFMKKRRALDYKRFSKVSQEQSKVIELINGMQEIKLFNAERRKRWSWEHVQARLFKISVESMTLMQIQTMGSTFFNQLKNILISLLSAKLVIDGNITLGMMLAISYIIGSLDGPISQFIDFIHAAQDAKISLERLNEIHSLREEEDPEETKQQDISILEDITIRDLSFTYTGAITPTLKNLRFTIPANKITAIVGASGSGKTTLVKVLLKFYENYTGEVKIGNIDLKSICQSEWRHHCGVVMQEGYIFNDTIAENIAVGEEMADTEKLTKAVRIANIEGYIESLPLKYKTKIGMEGTMMSTGQKQRLQIARAVYKDPGIIFFDEATSSLDAENEKQITENLDKYLKNRTAVIVAHRLSTVKKAYQIVVLKNGEIVEIGDHLSLIAQEGFYFQLVKNQLDVEELS